MTFGLPAGLEAWAKCPTEGCRIHVYGRRSTPNHCRLHGGTPAFQESTDEWGTSTFDQAERASSPPVPAATWEAS